MHRELQNMSALRLEAQLAAATDSQQPNPRFAIALIAGTLMRVMAGEFTLIDLLVDAAKY